MRLEDFLVPWDPKTTKYCGAGISGSTGARSSLEGGGGSSAKKERRKTPSHHLLPLVTLTAKILLVVFWETKKSYHTYTRTDPPPPGKGDFCKCHVRGKNNRGEEKQRGNVKEKGVKIKNKEQFFLKGEKST
jgi:hypothetical protein